MGRTLVLLHGYTGSEQDFAHVFPSLDRYAKTVSYDQRGHGTARDEAKSGPIDLFVLADDLLARLDRLRIERAHLLGHSMGGMVLLRFALAHPSRVASLILVGTGANATPIGPPLAPTLKHRLQGALHRDIARRLAASLYASDEVRARFERIVRRSHRRVHPRAMILLNDAIRSAKSVAPRLGEINAPTTVIVGENDDQFAHDAPELAYRIPRAELVRIPHASHYPHFEREAVFLEAIDRHFRALES